MLDPVLLELAVLLIEEANRVIGLLLHKVGHLRSRVRCEGIIDISWNKTNTL